MAYRQQTDTFVFNPEMGNSFGRIEGLYEGVALALFILLCIHLIYRFFITHTRKNIIKNYGVTNKLMFTNRKRINSIYKEFEVSSFSLFNDTNVFSHNLMTGELKGHKIVFFDFHPYDVSHTHHAHPFPCAIFRLFYDPLPNFTLSPVTLFNIQWQNKCIKNYISPNKEFNKNFIVQYDCDVMNDFRPSKSFVDYMLKFGRNLNIEKKDHYLLIYCKNIKASSYEYDTFIRQCLKIHSIFIER